MKEGLKEQLISEASIANVNYIISVVLENPELVTELVNLSVQNNKKVSDRASWVLTNLVDDYPVLIKPFVAILSDRINISYSDTIKRNVLRILMCFEIPEESHGKLLDLCFEIMTSPKEKVAAKVNAMQIIFNLSKTYPEIKPEFALIIQEEMPRNSTGFKNRGSKILKKLNF